MAVTKIIPIHFTIDKSVKYICNPHKTGDCLYIHSEHCVPETAALAFKHHLQEAQAGGKIIGRHLIQSFAPGEVVPETAHEIGKKLAGEILGGKYAFVMATHVDRGHIHNHFVWGAADVETHKRYHSSKRSYREIRAASDRLCERFNLSVIVPQEVGKHYAEYQAEKQGTSWKAKLKETIDAVLSDAVDFDDFLRRMEARGYEIKRGAHISFRASEQARFIRGKTLGTEYTEEAIKENLSRKTLHNAGKHLSPEPDTIKSVIDIEQNEKIKSSPGYRQWAAVFNLKQKAAAFNLVQQYGGMEAFEELHDQLRKDNLSLSQELNGMDATIRNLTELRNQRRAYGRTKDIYIQYQNLKSPKQQEKFYHEHSTDIIAHQSAKKALSKAKKPIPTSKEITAEINRIKSARTDVYARYKQSKAEVKEAYTVYKNLHDLMKHDRSQSQRRSNDLSR